MTRRRVIVVAAMSVAVVLSLYVAHYFLFTSGLRRALPWSATDIHELDVDLFPDYTLYLKARIPEEEFEPYAARLGLTPHVPARDRDDGSPWGIRWEGAPRVETWWDVSEELDGTHVRNDGHVWTFAKYENGYVYVKSYSH